MDYYEFVFKVKPTDEVHQDLLIHSLGEAGFDTFEESETGFKAYISLDQAKSLNIDEVLSPFKEQFDFSHERNLIPGKNWNEVWESNFEPLTIKDACYIRATFHAPHPEYPYEIVIDPKMAFGTGHHQTTAMVMEFILEMDFKDKRVLDMGCGTGILAILAAKRGATDLTAIDYDPLCYDSTLENTSHNGAGFIKVLLGSKEAIPAVQYDYLLANINRNILLDQMERYSEALVKGGILILSGFYKADCEILLKEARKYSLILVDQKLTDDWASLKLVKG
ncbi:50S ribosomal protein L11 methyltransferase [Arcticibacter eurypsychrophilus]|uniref:50S ribosomal protein L11 methyltransferase n=1 Tax=Arcticibacter eurypsychrophilus TaxID=1434752 RepID=UPI00084D57EF|nr:50S ribosomal protein L11 methyltransferase [Arcticibacter eurypsychrophilus]